MEEERIRYYVVIKGQGYWRPTKRMRDVGFHLVRCGPDSKAARAIARTWAGRWDAYRRGEEDVDVEPIINSSEVGYVYFLTAGDRAKIGYSKDPLGRASKLSTGIAHPIDAMVIVRGTRRDEKALHTRFAAYRRVREWFVLAHPIRLTMMRSAAAGRVIHDGEERPEPEQMYQPLEERAGPGVSTHPGNSA